MIFPFRVIVKMSEFNNKNQYILKFYYKKRKNATLASKSICDVYGPNTVYVRVAQRLKCF